ncbi:MSD3 protein, partial [Chaetorhynchus papuensis]|nr:MSD3 protein [Chaetorhynchus papuensis]
KMQNEIIKPAKYFSEVEKSVLLALVEKYKYVLECKKSDARTIALKQRTWQALAHEYNSQPSVSLRDFKQLKKCWENIKARTKKIMAHERREKVKRSISPLINTHIVGKEKIASIMPEQMYFLQSPPEEDSEYQPDASSQGINVAVMMQVVLLFKRGEGFHNFFHLFLTYLLLCGKHHSCYRAGFPENSPKDISIVFKVSFCWFKKKKKATSSKLIHNCLLQEFPVENTLMLFLLLFAESFVVSNRELGDEDKELVHFPVCEGTSQPEPSCSDVRIAADKNYRSKASQESALKKMHEEEHHQQMSILQLQLIQMNEVHVAKIQQIERECEMAEEEHRIKMEVLNKKKMYWERKLQTITKEWPVSSYNRPFPNSP